MSSFFLILITIFSLHIKNVGINEKPTFSYVVVYLDSENFTISIEKKEKIISVLVENAELKFHKTQLEPREKKFISKVLLNEIKESETKKSTAISTIMKDEKLKWDVKKSKNGILIFVGKDIPFTEKKDIDEFLKNSVMTRNYRALDRIFLLTEVGDEETKAKAYFAIGEMMFKMGIENQSNLLLLRSSTFYGAAGRKYLELGDIQNFALSYIKSSQALRWAMFFPEAKAKADFALEKIEQLKAPVPSSTKIMLLCSSALASIGRSKAGEAAEKIAILEKEFLEKSNQYERDEFQDISDCVFSALGSYEYEKGDFEKAGEYLTHVSEKFLKNDPVALPRYARALLKLGKTHLSKKYFFMMENSRFRDFEGEAKLGLFESLYKEGNKNLAIKYLYSAIENFPATKWEIKARLIAVQNREDLKDAYGSLGKKRMPRDDPIFYPKENLKFIITKMQLPESQIALAEYLKILNERMKNVEGLKDDKEIRSDIEFIFSILPVFRVMKIPPGIREEVQSNMGSFLENLVSFGNIVYAATLFFSFKEFLPPPYLMDYSKVQAEFERYGLLEAEEEKNKILQQFEEEKDKESFVQKFGEKIPELFIKYAEFLLKKGECEKAFIILEQKKEKVYKFEEYKDMLFRIGQCLYVLKSNLLPQLCKEDRENIFCKEYPFETTYDNVIKSLFEELEKIPEKLEEIRMKAISQQ